MHDIGTHRRRLAAWGLAAALAALPGAAAAAPAAELRPPASTGEDLSFNAFRLGYDRLMAAVDAGQVERGTGRRAAALWQSLREELLAFDARIAALVLEAKQRDEARQDRALHELIRAAAARERAIGRHVRALEELAPPVAPAAAKPPAKGGAAIEIVPADVSSGSTN